MLQIMILLIYHIHTFFRNLIICILHVQDILHIIKIHFHLQFDKLQMISKQNRQTAQIDPCMDVKKLSWKLRGEGCIH